MGDPLLPYTPRLVLEWLERDPSERRRSVEGSTLFADISGFTQLTERLARRGKAGAEEMGDILNSVFDALLTPAYEQQGGLLKWGGDAVLLLFDGPDHAARATAAAWEMQQVIRRVGRLRTSGGPVRLGMSIGVHTGALDVLLVGSVHRELIVTGPAASIVAAMEKVADAGEVVLSPAAAEAARQAGAQVGAAQGDGWVLTSPPCVPPLGVRAAKAGEGVDLAVTLSPDLRDHLLSGVVDHEHRHVAVGFIEVAGADALATARAESDLTDAFDEVIGRVQAAAAANEVTLLSTDVNADGCKVILTAGAPRRVGDDEGRILATLHTVLSEGSPLSLRAGANAGRVFAGDFGPFYRRVYSVAGDCVNLAARLMAAAAPGQLLVTETALERTGGRFATEAVPAFRVKGKADPVVAHRVVGLTKARSDRVTATPLVGRDRELALLASALDQARGGRGQSVDLVGPPGIGKSRLLQELAAVSGCPMLWVDGDIYGQATPYLPIRRFVRDQLDLTVDTPRSEVAERFRELMADAAPHMVQWLPLVGAVIDTDFPMTDVVADLDPETRKDRMEWAMSELLAALVTEPSILVFNDAHFMDDATVDLLRRISADAPGRPWLVITSYRADDRARVSPGTTVLELQPLDGAAADRLMAELTETSPLPSHLLAQLAERAGGNPLFLQELVRAAAEDGLSQLPDTIDGIISARIDRLDPARRRLLRAASVLGMTVERPFLREMLREAGHDTGALTDLEELDEFLEPAGGRHLQFRHHLVQEAAYEGLPYRTRTRLHASVAKTLERDSRRADRVDLLSFHAFAGGRYRSAWEASIAAGDKARGQYANAEAAECYRRALRAWEHLKDRPPEVDRVAEALGDMHHQLGDVAAAEAAYRRALGRCARGPVAEAVLREKVSRLRETAGRYPSALRWIALGHRALDGVAGSDADRTRLKLLVARARVRYSQGRKAESLRLAREALAMADAIGDSASRPVALEYMDLCETALGVTPDSSRSEQALAFYRANGDLDGQARMHNSLGVQAYFRGDWVEAVGHYSDAATAYRRAGRDWLAAVSDANVAEVLSDQGHLAQAEEILQASLRVFRGVGADTEEAFATYMLGRIAARLGDHDVARERFARARTHMADTGVWDEVVLIDAYRAECELLAGEPGTSLALADTALESAHEVDATPAVPLLHRIRGLALHRTGEVVEGRTELLRSLGTARDRGSLADIASCLGALIGCGAARSAAEEGAWRSERDALRTRLGMVPWDHPHAR